MILSASRRTDIPCYYSDWFMNRIKAGYILTRNPMNYKQISKIILTTDAIECIVFWTKDAQNILPHLAELDRRGYNYYFQYTLTPYDRTIERHLRNKSEIEDTFIELSKRIGKEHIIWRYDPIILNETHDIDYHKTHFERMCHKLSPYTKAVMISFVDTYSKLKTDAIRSISEMEMISLASYIGNVAKAYGISATACCEKIDMVPYGIKRSSCISKELIEKISDKSLKMAPDKNQRIGCGCIKSVDIGAYNTCKNGCVYCYANYSETSVLNNCKKHDCASELLIGMVAEGEKVAVRQ